MEIEKDKQNFLTISIKYKDAISLYDFKESLDGWYNEYNKHLSISNISKDEETLLIKEIKQNSIDVILVSSALLLINELNTIFFFFSRIKHAITWLSNKKGVKPKYDIEELENIKKIVSPVNSIDKSIHVSVNGDNNINNVLSINHLTVNVIRQTATDEIMRLSVKGKPEPLQDSSIKENILLKFIQIEGTENSINKNTKGIISEIDKKPHPIMFEEGIKHQIIHEEPFPFNKNYLANVKVHKEDDKIKAYTVMAIVDSYEEENDEQSENSLF
jgi:hypothetical protein